MSPTLALCRNSVGQGVTTSCAGLLDQGITTSGVYTIDPNCDGTGFSVYCDLTTLGGGWTYVGRNGSLDPRTDDALGSVSADPTATDPWHLSVADIWAIADGGTDQKMEVFVQDLTADGDFTGSCTDIVVLRYTKDSSTYPFTFESHAFSDEVHTGNSGYSNQHEGHVSWECSGPNAQYPKCLAKSGAFSAPTSTSDNLHWRCDDTQFTRLGRNGCCGANSEGNLLMFVRAAP